MENNNSTVYNPNSENRSVKISNYLYPNELQNEKSDLNTNYDTPDYNTHNGSNESSNGSSPNRLDHNLTLNPSQVLCMMTTVPQNIAARSLGEKHTPTRSSLRHSRMIVMNRNRRIPKKYLPYIIRNYKLVKSLKIITIILGIVMCTLSSWLVIWSPTLNATYYMHWNAVPIFFSGIVGCIFLGFCPRPYPGRKLGCPYHIAKFISILTTSVSIMATLVIFTLCIIHLIYLSNAICAPQDEFNSTCVCSTTNSTNQVLNQTYRYEDLTCKEVETFLYHLIMVSCVLNIFAVIFEGTYLYAHWASHRNYEYAKVSVRASEKESER